MPDRGPGHPTTGAPRRETRGVRPAPPAAPGEPLRPGTDAAWTLRGEAASPADASRSREDHHQPGPRRDGHAWATAPGHPSHGPRRHGAQTDRLGDAARARANACCAGPRQTVRRWHGHAQTATARHPRHGPRRGGPATPARGAPALAPRAPHARSAGHKAQARLSTARHGQTTALACARHPSSHPPPCWLRRAGAARHHGHAAAMTAYDPDPGGGGTLRPHALACQLTPAARSRTK
jgi:hypothetical protein